MATSLATSLPWAMSGCTYDANSGNDIRNSTVTPVWFDQGVASGSGTIAVRGGVTDGAGLAVTPGTGMTVNVGAGSFVVPNTASSIAGAYAATLASSGNLSLAASDPANPRIDIIVATANDTGTSASSGSVHPVTGTPAASPAAPAVPANSIVLAQIQIPALATSVTSGNITDKRPFTVASGGVLKSPKGTVTGYNGQLAFDGATGVFYHNHPSGPRQAHVLPFAPVQSTFTSNVEIAGPSETSSLASVTFTCDGNTDIKITYKIAGIMSPNPAAGQCVFAVSLDSNQLDEIDVAQYAADQVSISHGGFSVVYCTTAGHGDTPSAGTHTVFFTGVVNFSSNTVSVVASPTRPGLLRVEPVIL